MRNPWSRVERALEIPSLYQYGTYCSLSIFVEWLCSVFLLQGYIFLSPITRSVRKKWWKMEEEKIDIQKARGLLKNLGIQPYLCGYKMTLLALERIAENQECIYAVIKEIYLPIAEKLNCSTATVEVGIRRTSERAWKVNPELMRGLSIETLYDRPQTRSFLLMLYNACCTKK